MLIQQSKAKLINQKPQVVSHVSQRPRWINQKPQAVNHVMKQTLVFSTKLNADTRKYLCCKSLLFISGILNNKDILSFQNIPKISTLTLEYRTLIHRKLNDLQLFPLTEELKLFIQQRNPWHFGYWTKAAVLGNFKMHSLQHFITTLNFQLWTSALRVTNYCINNLLCFSTKTRKLIYYKFVQHPKQKSNIMYSTVPSF